MKHICLILFLLGITSMHSYSQGFEGGVLAGLNASQVDGDTYSGYNKPGIVAGGFVQTNLSRMIFTGMELKFTQKGSRKNPDPKAIDYQPSYLMRLSYAEIPLYLGVRTSEKISVLAGLSAGYLIRGTEYYDNEKLDEPVKHPFNVIDVQGFLGFRFKLSNRLFIDLRGAYSLLPIRAKPGNSTIYWDDSQFSNLLATTILYRLDF